MIEGTVVDGGDTISGYWVANSQGKVYNVNSEDDAPSFYKVDDIYATTQFDLIKGKTVAQAIAFDGSVAKYTFDELQSTSFQTVAATDAEVLQQKIKAQL